MSQEVIRLSAQDAAFMYGEDQRIPLHVGSMGIMEAAPLRDENGALDMPRLRANIENRLQLLRRQGGKIGQLPVRSILQGRKTAGELLYQAY